MRPPRGVSVEMLNTLRKSVDLGGLYPAECSRDTKRRVVSLARLGYIDLDQFPFWSFATPTPAGRKLVRTIL